jgi:hypothetical protein
MQLLRGIAMRNKERAVANYVAAARGSQGYLKPCRDCGNIIYLHLDRDGAWRPYASWAAGDSSEGEWMLHDCGVHVSE